MSTQDKKEQKGKDKKEKLLSPKVFVEPNTYWKAGWLYKKGEFYKKWRRRYFVLDKRRQILIYYKNDESITPKGAIHLQSYLVVEPDEDDDEENWTKNFYLKFSGVEREDFLLNFNIEQSNGDVTLDRNGIEHHESKVSENSNTSSYSNSSNTSNTSNGSNGSGEREKESQVHKKKKPNLLSWKKFRSSVMMDLDDDNDDDNEETDARIFELKADSPEEKQIWLTTLMLTCSGEARPERENLRVVHFLPAKNIEPKITYRTFQLELPKEENFEPIFITVHNMRAPDGSYPLLQNGSSIFGRIYIPKTVHVTACLLFAPLEGLEPKQAIIKFRDFPLELPGKDTITELAPKKKTTLAQPSYYCGFVIQSEKNMLNWEAETEKVIGRTRCFSLNVDLKSS